MRRRFFSFHSSAAAWELFWLSLIFLFLVAGCAHPQRTWQRISYGQPQMGVPFDIIVWAPPGATPDPAVKKAYARVAALNEILSDYETESELNRLSRTSGSGQWVPVSEELWFLLWQSQQLAVASDGAFDITVGPLSSLWRKARREKKFPEQRHLTAALEASGYRLMELDSAGGKVLLKKPGMKLDLGGIAKGYAADEALRVLRQEGFPRALVAAAGDIVAGERPKGTRGWRVALSEEPTEDFIWLNNGAVSTSGDLYQHLELNGVRYSHIVDPKTGIGLTNRVLVNVVANQGWVSDALATALSVMPPKQGMALLKKYRAEGRIVFAEQRKAMESPGFR